MDGDIKNPIVRMAPSPTGNLHLGTARTALFNFLFARKHGGKFILRIEDTDKERSKKEFEEGILEDLKWLGISHDEFFRQSDRSDIYASYVEKLLASGHAYVSQEEAREPGQRSEVIRFKNPNKKIAFSDAVRGEVIFETAELKDFVIAKSPEEPLYHLAVVVDDHLMGITHIIRGEDHISNTPRQILIQEAIGAMRPVYAHIPLILDNSKKKLSKRSHGEAVWINSYRKLGFLPDAVNNYLALLGWNPGTEQEIFSLRELAENFDIGQVQKSGAIFDEKKFRWINKEHLKRMDRGELSKIIQDKFGREMSAHLVEVVTERIETLDDIDKIRPEVQWAFTAPRPDLSKINWKDTSPEETRRHLEKAREILDDEKMLMEYAEEAGKGNVLWPLRYALTGQEKSPDPFTVIRIIGTNEAQSRVNAVLENL